MNHTPLDQQTCTACSGATPPLTAQAAATKLSQLSGWETDNWLKIRKNFQFSNFAEVITFINKIAQLAQAEGHHPDFCLHDYKELLVTLETHKINGLSDNDFIMAAKIDREFNSRL